MVIPDHSFPFAPPPLDLDSEVLPPLDDFSSLDDTLGDLTGDLGTLTSLELPLSHTLSPRLHSPLPDSTSIPSDSSVSSRSLSSSPTQYHQVPDVSATTTNTSIIPDIKQECCPDVRAALDEVSARLKAASFENSALRSRVADLVKENRSLRSSLDISQKQAAVANPLLLGLAQVSAETSKALANALNVVPRNIGNNNNNGNKKRKRGNAAGKTLACLFLMCGFFFGSPGVIHDAERTDANLPAIWNNGNAKNKISAMATTGSSKVITQPPPVRPSLCLRSLEQLPPPELVASVGSEVSDKEEVPSAEDIEMDVNDNDNKTGMVKVKKQENLIATTAHVIEPAMKKRRVGTSGGNINSNNNKFSYVMCRDAANAVEQVAECSDKQEKGLQCGAPHSISLIMPAAALVGEENDDGKDDEYAEVLCNIMSVKKIPAEQTAKLVSGVSVARSAMMNTNTNNHIHNHIPKRNAGHPVGIGRVLSSVREEVVGT